MDDHDVMLIALTHFAREVGEMAHQEAGVPCTEQAFAEMEWDGFVREWISRHPNRAATLLVATIMAHETELKRLLGER